MSTAKAVEITKMDANPSKMVEAASHTGKLRVSKDTIAALTTDLEANDILMMCQVPANAKIHSIKIYNDDLDTDATPAMTANVGIYNGPDTFTDGSTQYATDAVIDLDAYGTVITTLQAANTAGVELRFETFNINTISNFVWEDAGLSADPKVNLRIAVTIGTVAATPAAGDITMVVEYSVN